jgi:hypothetical protein
VASERHQDGERNVNRALCAVQPHHRHIINVVLFTLKSLLRITSEPQHFRVRESLGRIRTRYENKASKIPFEKFVLTSTRIMSRQVAERLEKLPACSVQPSQPPAQKQSPPVLNPPPVMTTQPSARMSQQGMRPQSSGISPLDPELNPYLTQQLISASRSTGLSSLTVPRPDFGVNSQPSAIYNTQSNPSRSQSISPASLDSHSPFNRNPTNSAPPPAIQSQIDAFRQQQLEQALLLQILAQANQPAAVPRDIYSAPVLPLQFAPPSRNPQLDRFVAAPQDPELISTINNLVHLLNLNN